MRTLHSNEVSFLIRLWTFLGHWTGHKRTYQILSAFLLSLVFTGCGRFQDPNSRPSPLASDTLQSDGHIMSITYSSPRVRERKIWDGLVPFDKIWRTGANEATIFETSQDLLLEGKSLPKGKYAVFSIPNDKEWTIIFNKEWDQWGAYGYDEGKDQLRLYVKPETNYTHQEEMTFKMDTSTIEFRWETLGYSLKYTTN